MAKKDHAGSSWSMIVPVIVMMAVEVKMVNMMSVVMGKQGVVKREECC